MERISQTRRECEALGAKLDRLSALRSQPVWYRLTVDRSSVEFSVNPRVSPASWKWNYSGYIINTKTPTLASKKSRLMKEARYALMFRRHHTMLHLIAVLKDEDSMKKDVVEMLASDLIRAQRAVRKANAEVEYAEFSLSRFVEAVSR
jgi:hypothetical protein